MDPELFLKKYKVNPPPILELSTTKGGQYQIDLSDRSRVWLNASSTLIFPKEFGNSERRVELMGEDYFEIAHDKKKGLYHNVAISRSRDLSAVLQALEETGQVEFKINGRKITVKQGKEKR